MRFLNAPSLEEFKARLDGALDKSRGSLEVLELDELKRSNPNHSIIL